TILPCPCYRTSSPISARCIPASSGGRFRAVGSPVHRTVSVGVNGGTAVEVDLPHGIRPPETGRPAGRRSLGYGNLRRWSRDHLRRIDESRRDITPQYPR